MKLAQDYRNIAALYLGEQSNQQNVSKIEPYLKFFSEENPFLFLKQVHGNMHVYEWKNNNVFINGFSPCLIVEAITSKYLGRTINLQNKNILEKKVYSNFLLTENSTLTQMNQVKFLGNF